MLSFIRKIIELLDQVMSKFRWVESKEENGGSKVSLPNQNERIGRLVDAIMEAHAQALPGQKWYPRNIDGIGLVTYCNEAINFVCKAIGYVGFDLPDTSDKNDAELANRICGLLETDKHWTEVTFEAGQYHANNGILVLGAWQNPSGPHGHVVVIRPGTLDYSGQWACNVPKCLNVGREVFLDKSISYAFGKDAKPKLYALKEMMS